MAFVQPWIHPLLNALKRPTPWRCVSLWWVLLCLGACSQDEASVELECQGLEKSHTLTERDGVATVEDTTLTVKRHFSLIQHELNSVLCDQWDERQIHCWVEDHPKSKNKTFKKSYVEDFSLNRRDMKVTVSTQKMSQSETIKIHVDSDFSGECRASNRIAKPH